MANLRGAALCALLILGSALASTRPAAADAVSDFYKGKQIRMVIRTTVGGDYDQYSRLLARFMGKHIPGNPSILAVNMPGGGGITAANYMAQVAPRDGTVIGIVSQGLAADQAMGMSPQLKADLREFNWIANVVHSNQLLVVRHTSPTKTIEDAKRSVTTIGTTGAGSASVQYPAFYNNIIGTKFKIVFGYPGGQHIDLAMERGEVEGRGTNPYSGWMASKPTWIPQKLIIPLIQSGLEKEPELPDVPLILEQPVKPEAAAAIHGGSINGRAPARYDARRSRRAPRCIARSLRGDGERFRFHRRRQKREPGDPAAERRHAAADHLRPAQRASRSARADEDRAGAQGRAHDRETGRAAIARAGTAMPTESARPPMCCY